MITIDTDVRIIDRSGFLTKYKEYIKENEFLLHQSKIVFIKYEKNNFSYYKTDISGSSVELIESLNKTFNHIIIKPNQYSGYEEYIEKFERNLNTCIDEALDGSIIRGFIFNEICCEIYGTDLLIELMFNQKLENSNRRSIDRLFRYMGKRYLSVLNKDEKKLFFTKLFINEYTEDNLAPIFTHRSLGYMNYIEYFYTLFSEETSDSCKEDVINYGLMFDITKEDELKIMSFKDELIEKFGYKAELFYSKLRKAINDRSKLI